MCEIVIAHRKPKNAPHARTSQVSTKWVRTRTSQLATAHRNLRSHIASHALKKGFGTRLKTSLFPKNTNKFTYSWDVVYDKSGNDFSVGFSVLELCLS